MFFCVLHIHSHSCRLFGSSLLMSPVFFQLQHVMLRVLLAELSMSVTCEWVVVRSCTMSCLHSGSTVRRKRHSCELPWARTEFAVSIVLAGTVFSPALASNVLRVINNTLSMIALWQRIQPHAEMYTLKLIALAFPPNLEQFESSTTNVTCLHNERVSLAAAVHSHDACGTVYACCRVARGLWLERRVAESLVNHCRELQASLNH